MFTDQISYHKLSAGSGGPTNRWVSFLGWISRREKYIWQRYRETFDVYVVEKIAITVPHRMGGQK